MDFQLPELGEGVYEAELVAWLVKVGDSVKRGQSLMEVLTDKASMEVPAPFAGRITDFRAEPGQQLKVGDIVLTYSPAGQQEPTEEPKPSADGERREQDGQRLANQTQRSALHAPRSSASAAVQAAPS